jgi:hypothetical protein
VTIDRKQLRHSVALAVLFALGCAAPQKEPLPLTPPSETGGAVVRRELPEDIVATPIPPAPSPASPVIAALPPERTPSPPLTPPPVTEPPVVVPPNLLYVCVTKVDGVRKQVGIEFVPKVHQLCKKHPEMGPCQYERDLCRASGGRVFAASGEEITMAIEEEYDKKVMRVRFRAN